MAKLTIGQKAERVLELLMGLRHPRVASTLAAYGFTEADLKSATSGWWRRRVALAIGNQRFSKASSCSMRRGSATLCALTARRLPETARSRFHRRHPHPMRKAAPLRVAM